ncbi:MAG: flagellar M-ring protein FliF [Candidatus Latescibacteria bacterium]|nr:flagellar M-ring protein FliF [Candidatus Latescibacterota bacterium]
MDAIRAYLEKAREMFDELGRNQKIGVGVGAGVVLIALIYFASSGSGGEDTVYRPLYTDIDMKEAGEVSSRLREMNQDFQLGADGSLVLVPDSDRAELRNILASEGFPKTGYIGYEVFDNMPLGITDFLQQVKMRQALEGELKTTILALEQVEDVRLHVVTPKPSLFTDRQNEPTASILLDLRPRMTLDKQQVSAIQNLVASSVEGLNPKNITVLDNAGHMLSEEIDPLAMLTTKQIKAQRNVENYMQREVQEVLDLVLGPDQAKLKVSIDLDFREVQEEVERYDPTNAVLRSEERNEEESAEAGTSNRSVSNYEIDRTIQRITGAPGRIRRISASLMLNDKVPDPDATTDPENPVYKTRTAEEMDQFGNLVRGALGMDEAGRGDRLEVSRFVFAIQDLRVVAEKKRKEVERDELITTIVINVGKAIAIIIALLVLRAIIGAIGRGVAREEEIAMEAQRELEEDDAGEELPETPHEIILGRIAQLISERPEDAAKLIRTMLLEDASNRQRQGQ